MDTKAYEAAHSVKAFCKILERRDDKTYQLFIENYRQTLEDLENMDDDFKETDVYELFARYKDLQAAIEDIFAQMAECLDEASAKSRKVIEQLESE